MTGVMKIIDIHAHIFPEKIAQKAAVNIGAFYDIQMHSDGSVSTLLKLGEKCNINTFVVHSVATVPEQVEVINDFIYNEVSKHSDKLIGFATIHPDYENIETEIERIMSLGFKGVKIHPDFQKFNIDSKDAFKIYETIEGRLPLLVHTGDFRYEYSKPKRMAAVVDRFPKLDVICAHLGGWSEWEEAAQIYDGRRIWVDTSSSLYAVSPEKVRKIIDLYGVDQVLFGSDYPMWSPCDELELIKKIDFTEEELEKIMHKNAEKLLNI